MSYQATHPTVRKCSLLWTQIIDKVEINYVPVFGALRDIFMVVSKNRTSNPRDDNGNKRSIEVKTQIDPRRETPKIQDTLAHSQMENFIKRGGVLDIR